MRTLRYCTLAGWLASCVPEQLQTIRHIINMLVDYLGAFQERRKPTCSGMAIQSVHALSTIVIYMHMRIS